MKVLIGFFALATAVHGGLLPHLETPPVAASSSHPINQIPETKIIKLIHETVSLPHATLPTPPLKVLKVIHESAANVADLPAPVQVFPPKIIKVIHQSASHAVPTPVAPPKILKVIHQSAPIPAAASAPAPALASANTKLLKVIHEYAPRHYAPVPAQSTKILKIINQQAAPVGGHSALAGQNVKVLKVIHHLGGGGDLASSASHGSGKTYASGYGHGYATPSSTVKVIKVLEKPAHLPSSSRW